MFRRSALSSAISAVIAFSGSAAVFAQEQETPTESSTGPVIVEEVVVTGIRGSLARALDVKRDAIQVKDAIVAEDIGKFPDNNVVEALQRVTGVQVTDRGAGEVSTVAIRGLNDVTTTVNGRKIFTASGRSVALQDIPANLLRQVDVYKTRSADLIESGIAGQIDIRTNRPFDFDDTRVSIAARGVTQVQSGDTDPNISGLVSNRWDTSFGEFGALLNVSYAETSYRDQSITAGAMVPFITGDPESHLSGAWSPYQQIAPVPADAMLDPQYQGQQVWVPGLEEGLPYAAGSTLDINGEPTEYYLARDAVFASDFSGLRKRPAANISLQFAPNDKSEYLFEAFYNGYRNDSFNSLLFAFVNNHADLGANPDDGVVLFEGTNIIKERTVGSAGGFTSGDLTRGKTDSWVYALGGDWDITDDLNIRSEIVYQKSTFETEFFAMRANWTAYQVAVDFNDGDGYPEWSYADNPATPGVDESDATDSSQWAMAELYDNGGKNEGDSTSFTLDGEYLLEFGPINKISFGMRYDQRSASESTRTQGGVACGDSCSFSDFDGIGFTNDDFFDGRADVPESWFVANGNYIFDHADEVRSYYNTATQSNSFLLSSELSLLEWFNIDESTTSLYVQADYEGEIGGMLVDGQFGFRYFEADTDMEFTDEDTLAMSTAQNSNNKVLSSALMRLHFTDDLLMRISYGETIRLPEFGQLNSNIRYFEDVTNIGYGTASGGNPNLAPTESKNYDLTLEWYFADASSLYGALFRREIDGLVVDYRRPVQYQGPNDDAPYTYILASPDNASEGELQGIEIGFVYFPDYLPSFLDGLGTQISFTALDSSQTLPILNDAGELIGTKETSMFGVSDTSYSVVLAYDRDNYEARLSYVWREDFLHHNEAALFANPLGVYFRPENSLDFQFSYDINDDFVITLDATNLLDELYQAYYEHEGTHNFGSAIFSQTWALGVRYSF